MAFEDILEKLKSKKIAAAMFTGVLAVTTAVYAYIDAKIETVNQRIDLKIETLQENQEIQNKSVESKLISIENLLIRIDDRVYEITKNSNKEN